VTHVPQWVLDTNVLVSGLISPSGPPGRLVDAILARRLQLVVDDRIIREYREVLARPKFRIEVGRLLAFWGILPFQVHLSAMALNGLFASDPEDTMFLEVAAASAERVLVTGNLKHFPRKSRGPVRVLSPVDAWGELTTKAET